jgi:hypothetical protein
MRTRRSVIAIGVAAIMMLAASAAGHTPTSRTYLTFSAPVALPGVTLGSGTYVFESIGVAKDVVRVTGRDNKIVYLTAFTNEVVRPSGAPLAAGILFGERPAGTPQAIKAWFPEHSRTGREFIYP